MSGVSPQTASSSLGFPVNRVTAARRAGTVRAALLGGVSLLALAGATLPRTALAQTINGPSGPINISRGSLTVTVNGVISGGSTAVNASGNVTSLANLGQISGSAYGIAGNGNIGTLTNGSLIQSTSGAAGVGTQARSAG